METFAFASLASLLLVAPVWILLHYATKWHSSKSMTRDDDDLLESLSKAASRMESRLGSLTDILETDIEHKRSSS